MKNWLFGVLGFVLWIPVGTLFVIYALTIKLPYLHGGGDYKLLDWEKKLFWAVIPQKYL